MAELGSKTGTTYNSRPADTTASWSSEADNCLETIANADDGDFGAVSINSTNDYGAGFDLENMPIDFGNMTTDCNVRMRYGWDAAPNANEIWHYLGAKIVSSGGTVLAAATSGGVYQNVATSITTATATTSANVQFGYVNTGANKAAWDGAIFQIVMYRERIKGGGTHSMQVYAAEINGVYDISTGPGTQYYFIT